MAAQARIQQLVENNKAFAETWKNPMTMVQLRAYAKGSEAALAILTCMDPRCVPEAYFGPEIQAAVLRNAGGRASDDVIRTLLVLRTLMDLKAVVVVHHTDCGMTHISDDEIVREAKDRTPAEAAVREIEAIENTKLGMGCFAADQFEQTIREDVRALQKVDALKGVEILGMALDLDSGLVRDV